MKTKRKAIGNLLAASLVAIPSFFITSCEQDDGLGEYEMRQQYTLSRRMMGANGEVSPDIPIPRDTTELVDPVRVDSYERVVSMKLVNMEPEMSNPKTNTNIPDDQNPANGDYEDYYVDVNVKFTLYKERITPEGEDVKYSVNIDSYNPCGFFPGPFTRGTDQWGNNYQYADEESFF